MSRGTSSSSSTRRPSTSARDERFKELLGAKGLRVTEQRLLILRALASRRAPVSFAELGEEIGSADLDRVTIYRNFVAMADAGILIRSQLGDGVSRYELPASGEPTHKEHPHLVCVDCGNVSCLPQNTVTLKGDAARRVTDVQLRGHCEVCVR